MIIAPYPTTITARQAGRLAVNWAGIPLAAYGLLDDIVKGSYRELAARLRVGQTA
jgi:hypothetical protein